MAEGIIGEIGGQLVGRIFSGILWFGVAALIVAVVGFFLYYFFIYQRKFDIKIKIKSERAEDNYSIIFDKAAILKEFKTKLPYLRVWGLKRDFPVGKYNVLQKTNEGDYIEILRKGEDEFYFLTPSKIIKTEFIKADGKVYPIAEQSQMMIDPEIAFWMAKRKEDNKKMFDTEKLWMKIIPYIPHIVTGVLVIFILYILMDSLPTILQNLNQLVESLNQARAAEVIIRNP